MRRSLSGKVGRDAESRNVYETKTKNSKDKGCDMQGWNMRSGANGILVQILPRPLTVMVLADDSTAPCTEATSAPALLSAAVRVK